MKKAMVRIATVFCAVALTLATEQTSRAAGKDLGTYKYDGSGQIYSIGPDSAGITTYYFYDSAGRLIQFMHKETSSGPVLLDESYEYDGYGNLTRFVRGGTADDIPVSASTNRLATAQYDEAGNVTSYDGVNYLFDPVGTLTQKSGDWGTALYIYTADDERIGIQGPDGSWRYTVRDIDNKVLREWSAQSWNGPLTWVEDYVYSDGQLVAGERAQSQGGRRHFHLDHLGTPRLITGPSGQQYASHDYYPFGREITDPRQEMELHFFDTPEPMKFTGHERDFGRFFTDPPTDYMHARYYLPHTGRFLSIDPVPGDPAVPQSWNRYAYTMNDPVNFSDPTGMYPCIITLPDGRTVPGECVDVTANADESWYSLGNMSNFFAGFGDSMTFGATGVIREAISEWLFNTNTPVDPCSDAYALGEYTEIGLELAATGGSMGLRVAASQASRKAVRQAARAATRGVAKESGEHVHHINPLFGHPGGGSTLFPTGGLPASVHSGSWNLQVLNPAQHKAAHRYLRNLEKGASAAVNPGTTGTRAGRNLAGQQQCGR
jgi:RHS repeat-associated protein